QKLRNHLCVTYCLSLTIFKCLPLFSSSLMLMLMLEVGGTGTGTGVLNSVSHFCLFGKSLSLFFSFSLTPPSSSLPSSSL
ncbi:uncharacterized protein BJ212DRAFT_1412320, partial [Suillus subaureus]